MRATKKPKPKQKPTDGEPWLRRPSFLATIVRKE
jgi:hypothetical protein